MELSSWIVAISTIGLFLVTFIYVIFTYKILRSNEKTTFELNRPYIVVKIFSENLWLKLSIKNIGRRPAQNVSINFIPDLVILDKQVQVRKKLIGHTNLLKQTYFPPNFELITALMETIIFVKNENLPKLFNVNIMYEDENNKKLPIENYIIDLSNFVYSDKMEEFSNIYYLKELIKKLEKIEKDLDNISNKN